VSAPSTVGSCRHAPRAQSRSRLAYAVPTGRPAGEFPARSRRRGPRRCARYAAPQRPLLEEDAISEPDLRASGDYADTFLPEDAATVAARERARDSGVDAVGPAVGAVLAFLAASLDARAVVEIGTGAGVSACWLLRGMPPTGVLTSIDSEAEHQRQARTALTEAGVSPNRVRLINGTALDVMSRLADAAYDLVVIDVPATEYGELLDAAVRLLRPRGVVLFHDALAGGHIADTARRDPHTIALRDLAKRLHAADHLLPVALPIGDGLLAAVRVPEAS
jgi:predicted O-methyltransferase YrrM